MDRAEYGSLQMNNPLTGGDLESFKREWDNITNVLKPKQKEPIIIKMVKPVRYGHAIRYEWRDQTTWQ